MFTGIIEELGTVELSGGNRLTIRCSVVLADATLGSSIAVNGCCLTVVDLEATAGWWTCDVSDETLARTNLGTLLQGDAVNLERPVRAGGRLGGHIVQGHVDGVGIVLEPVPDLRVRVPDGLGRYVVEKGSIAVDGVSLTVVDAHADSFTAAIIPYTSDVTTLGRRAAGDAVNLEVDVTAKYVERLLSWKDQ